MKPAEKYILESELPFRNILLQLQIVIPQIIPTAEMLYKWKMPFFYLEGKRPFCYLNCTKKYVDLGFFHGAHLTKHTNVLISEKRKHMKSLRYFSVEDINHKILKEVLCEAHSFRELSYYK